MNAPAATHPQPQHSALTQHDPHTTTHSTPSQPDKQPTPAVYSSRQHAPKSHANHRVPLHTALPTTVPSDLVPPSAAWQPARHAPYTIHPAAWRVVAARGPAPFTTEVVYQLPATGALVAWESRPFRRQTEQRLVGHVTGAVAERRAALRLAWYRRIVKVDIRRWSWWAILFFNVGSHALVYAAICLFIPYFNTGYGLYEANTGWSSNFLAAAFWLAACFCEIMALATQNEVGKWYTPPTPLLPSHQKLVDPRAYECAYIDRITPRPTVGLLLRRLDVWIVSLRLLGVLAFTVAAVAFSGAFDNLSWPAMIGSVLLMYIVSGACFLLAAVLSLAECCHSWVPLVQGSVARSLGSMDWWTCVLYVLGSLALLAYGVDLWKQPSLLDQRQGPAIPYILFACIFTVMDWLHAIEQGERCEYELGPSPHTEPAAHALASHSVAEPTVVGAAAAGDALAAEESQVQEHRVDVRSPRHGLRVEDAVAY